MEQSSLTGVTAASAGVDRVLPGVLRALAELVAIPSVSAQPVHHDAVRASAAAVAALFDAAGLHTEVVTAEGGLPAVIGTRPAPPGAPTVLLYAHHDVQPVGDGWTSAPFAAQRRGERLFGRGTADDKGGVAVHLAALLALGEHLGVGITLLVEGEEEIGSPSLARLLEEHGERLRADVIVVADAVNADVGTPALTTSLRGMLDVEIGVGVLAHDLHSGAWGGAVPDAALALLRLLASLHDADGSVAVAGLVSTEGDDVVAQERLRRDAGVPDGVGLIGRGTLADRLWRQPSITVIGTDLPSITDASPTLRAGATARVSVRLAPGDEVDRALDALAAHLAAHEPFGAEVSVRLRASAEPSTLPVDGPAFALACDALEHAWGTEPVVVGVGGSIPLIAGLHVAFPEAEVLVTAVADPDTRAHGTDESLHLADFRRACIAETLLLARLAVARADSGRNVLRCGRARTDPASTGSPDDRPVLG